MGDKPINVHVQLSAGWGYLHHYNELQRVLNRDIGAQKFNITYDRDVEKTKNFEVSVDGQLVHSAQQKSAGKCDTDRERFVIRNYMRDLLAKRTS